MVVGFTVFPFDKRLFKYCSSPESLPVSPSVDFRKIEEGNKIYFRNVNEKYTDMVIVRSRVSILTREMTLRRDRDYLNYKDYFDRGDYLFAK